MLLLSRMNTGGMHTSSVGEQFTEIYLKKDSNVQVQLEADFLVLGRMWILGSNPAPSNLFMKIFSSLVVKLIVSSLIKKCISFSVLPKK